MLCTLLLLIVVTQMIMPAVKKRILLKLYAVGAFLQHRRSTQHLPLPDITALKERTVAAVREPMPLERAGTLRVLHQQWIAVITHWHNDYEQTWGHAVRTDCTVMMLCTV
jgi:hypothetical protein